MVEEVGDLNYRLTLPPYMKTHPVFYVGRLKRYVDPCEATYPHPKVESEEKDSPPTSCPYEGVVDSVSEGHHANTADPLDNIFSWKSKRSFRRS